jgi:hypothetical protein
VSGSVFAGNCLNNSNIIFSRSSLYEEEEILSDLSDSEMKALRKDKAFMRIWDGGVMACSLEVRSMVTVDDQDRLYLNGRRFTRSSWRWRPPPIIRHQGRLAKDYPDPTNEHPLIRVENEKGDLIWQDKCVCGGELIKDSRGYLYCVKCNIIYE